MGKYMVKQETKILAKQASGKNDTREKETVCSAFGRTVTKWTLFTVLQ